MRNYDLVVIIDRINTEFNIFSGHSFDERGSGIHAQTFLDAEIQVLQVGNIFDSDIAALIAENIIELIPHELLFFL